MAFHLFFSSSADPFLSLVSGGQLSPVCISQCLWASFWLSVMPLEQEAQVGLLNLCLQIPHCADHCKLSFNCSFLSPSLSIWKLGLEKGFVKSFWTFLQQGRVEAYPTQFFLSSSCKKRRWREEWRGLNICQGKEKWVQPGRGVASTANCWKAGFWGTGEGEIW